MTALLDVPAIRERVLRFSLDDYHRWSEGQPTELLRGIVIEKMSKSPLHYDTIKELREILAGQIQPEWVLRQEGPLTFADSEPEPDLAVVRGPRADYRTAHPTTAQLVIEVAFSSLEIDRVKALIYSEARVQEYWIVCPQTKQIEVYRHPAAGDGYEEHIVTTSPAQLECDALPGVRVDLATLFR